MKQHKHHILFKNQFIGVQAIYAMTDYRQNNKNTQKKHRSKPSNRTTHTHDSNGRKENDDKQPTKKRLKRIRPNRPHETKQTQCNKQGKQ